MQALIQALINAITGDAPLGGILGGAPAVYLTEAPESAALPLVILHLGSGRLNHDFAGNRITFVPVSFQMIAADINTALTAAQRLGALLDNATLGLSAGSLIACTRSTSIQPAMPGFNSLQNGIYTAALQLECQIFNAV